MRILVALGGNALLRRGEPLTAENQRKNVKIAAETLAPIGREHQLIVSHGNGPQVGLLALQGAAYSRAEIYPLDVLGAETEGMIGYMIEQELGNILPFEQPFATLLSMTEVDPDDPAWKNPDKPIGPVYSIEEAERLAAEKGWSMAPDGAGFRRVVPSPKPKRIFQIRPVRWLLEKGCIVICAGGGGIPTMYGPDGKLHGVEAVVDKDRAGALHGTRARLRPLRHGDGRRCRLSRLGNAGEARDLAGLSRGAPGPSLRRGLDGTESRVGDRVRPRHGEGCRDRLPSGRRPHRPRPSRHPDHVHRGRHRALLTAHRGGRRPGGRRCASSRLRPSRGGP